MKKRDEDIGYRVEVKHRALPPSPWKWEIYRGAEPMWVEQSRETFRSRDEALKAGAEALSRLLEKRSNRSSWT